MSVKTKWVDNSYKSSLNKYLIEIRRDKILTFKEEKKLSERILNGDKKAKENLIRSNLKLVVKIAMGYYSYEVDLLDIIQEGNIGLIKAAEKYDYKKNVRFSTYASFWIRQCIVRALNNKRRMIRFPQRKEEKLKKIAKAIQRCSKNLGRKPNSSELSYETNINKKEIKAMLNLPSNVISIDSSNESEGLPLKNIIGDSKYNPSYIVMRNYLNEKAIEMLGILTQKEKKVLLLRYSFFTGKKYTLKNIGERFSISPETARQIEKRALQKIKENFNHLKDFII